MVNKQRRAILCAGAAALSGCAATRSAVSPAVSSAEPVPPARAGHLTVDMHSHAGRVIASRPGSPERPFVPVTAPMREGGMNVIVLAVVTDTYVTHVTPDRRIETYRDPAPGELYALGTLEFKRAHALIDAQHLNVVVDAATLRSAATLGPSVIIASEGADFLEGRLDRVDEAYDAYGLRHLQLTHYRVNELGDIQTAAAVHGGLTDFGADVIRRCNRLGMVVDVAHGTYALVKRAAETSTKPLVLSHTSLASHPRTRSRLIAPEHAKLVAQTGGVIGVWPLSAAFPNMQAMAAGIKQLADIVGIEHVGLGSDMLGLLSPPVFANYRQLPELAAALREAGFTDDDVSAVLGDNYARVFVQSMQ